MNNLTSYQSMYMGTWGNPFNKWNPHANGLLKVAIGMFLLLAVSLFPFKVLQGLVSPIPVVTPNKALDPVEMEKLLNNLFVARNTCLNPVPLRCESPIRGSQGQGG